MATGTVKWFNDVKATDSSLPMTAVKISSLISLCNPRWTASRPSKEGQKVTCDLKVGAKKANRLTTVKPANSEY